MSPATRTLLSSKEFGMHDLPKGTVTLLFTDIEGVHSTASAVG